MLAMGALAYHEFVLDKTADRGAANHPRAEETDFDEMVEILLWIGLPAVVLAIGGGWWLTRRALAPIAALTQEIERIQDYSLLSQLPRSGNGDELDRLTEVFNKMAVRLDGSFQRIREFTLHASHELKTPLTVLHGELESALREEPLNPAQRERIVAELGELQRLAKIVDSLTLLTKADAGQIQMKREPLQLDDIVREIFADAQILAKPADIQVQLGNCEPATVLGNANRLRQLLLNLVDNAIKYNLRQGSVNISLTCADGIAALIVTNTGPGIAPELLPRVFDRFFRGDESHSSEIEGCGLGLSIAQWIVSSHKGQIRITSTQNERTTVIVFLPLELTATKTIIKSRLFVTNQ